MAANETLVNAAAKAYRRRYRQDFGGWGGVDSGIHAYLDSKIEEKKKKECLDAGGKWVDNTCVMPDNELEEEIKIKETEEGLDSKVETEANSLVEITNPRQIDANYDIHGHYKPDFPDLYPDFEIVTKDLYTFPKSPLEMKSPFTYNAELVEGARQMYQTKRYANRAMGRALASAGRSIDGSIGDFLEMKTLERETKKEEERLKKEKEQQELDRQTNVLNNFVLKSGENNIDQLGTDLYKQVQDKLYALKDEYLVIYDEPDNSDKQRKLNDIMVQMTSLDSELTSHSTETANYQKNVLGDLFSKGMDGDVTNLQNAFYTNATEINYNGQDWSFKKELIDGKMKMVLTNPTATEQIKSIETSMNSLKDQKDQFSEEEYNKALEGWEEELSQYKKVLDPKEEFTSSTVYGKTDGAPINTLLGQIDKIANNGQTESLQNIQGIIEQAVTDPKTLSSYANDAIPGQGKSMREHFEEMFPDGIPIENENGDIIEYRTIDQIFNSRNPYYRENDGEKVLAELVVDYYTRIAINRFNVNKQGNAKIIGIEGSDILKIDNYGETTFGLSKEEGNKFRAWVNDNYPKYAREIDLDREYSSFTNTYIAKAWRKLGEEYKKATQFQEYDDIISKYYLNK